MKVGVAEDQPKFVTQPRKIVVSRMLSSVPEEATAQRIRDATRCGWPLGSTAFVKELEERAGRRLHPLPAGRPKANNGRAVSHDGQLMLEGDN